MQNVISIAGATSNLGGRVASALRKRGAAVRALVRPGTAPERLSKLRQQQIEIVEVDLTQPDALAHAIETMLADPGERRRSGARARAHIEASFETGVTTAALLRLVRAGDAAGQLACASTTTRAV